MRTKRKGSRHEDRRPPKEAPRKTRRSEEDGGARKGKKARREESSEDESKDSRRERREARRRSREESDTPTLTRGSPKMLTKEIRAGGKEPKAEQNQFMALLRPFVIVANDPEEKTVIADAGTIVQLCDQQVFFRDTISPVTHRGDERLVRYGKPDKPTFGWLPLQSLEPKAMKQVKGPTFLVQTKREEDVSAWDRFRFRIGRARKSDSSEWVVPWLVRNGAKYLPELRAVVREFGGKPIKDEGFDARCAKALSLILKTEIDMKTAKEVKTSKKSKKGKKGKQVEVVEKKTTKKSKVTKKAKASKASGDRITAKHDEHVIRRLVKENPRRAGSAKAKIWDRIKKGMTVGTFITKGGTRSAVKRYIENGWIKLLRPKGGSDDE